MTWQTGAAAFAVCLSLVTLALLCCVQTRLVTLEERHERVVDILRDQNSINRNTLEMLTIHDKDIRSLR